MENLKPSLTSIYTAQKIINTYKKTETNKLSIYINLAIVLFFVSIGITLYNRYKRKCKKKEERKKKKMKLKKKIDWLHNKMKLDEKNRLDKENERIIQQTNKFFVPPHSTIPTLSYKNHYVDSINLMDRVQKNRLNTQEVALNPYLI